MQEFVEDWLICDTPLGEGAYGEVRLLLNRKSDERIACKIINHAKYKDALSNINREVIIHKMLDHPNIIKFYGRRQLPLMEYLFLEYASGGELFQMIEPDVGMASRDAQNYFSQLLDGLKYIHSKGIAHRDIKPENLLISTNGVLKISDFGLATLFRLKGKERLLDKRCGTKPYLAPEVLCKRYHAAPADIWSCGIVLVAMLTGELPWAEPTEETPEYSAYVSNDYISVSPWCKLGNTTLSLVKHILAVNASVRFSIEKIRNHPWMKFNFESEDKVDSQDGSLERFVKRCNTMVESETRRNQEPTNVTLSQPLPTTKPSNIYQLINEIKSRQEQVCFSQPTHNEDLIISSQFSFTQRPLTKDNFQNLIKRMTRFYVKTSYESTLEVLCAVLDKLNFVWGVDPSGALTIVTVDAMKNSLTFKAIFINMEGKLLVEFRLSKGCGLDFKKKFMKIKESLMDVILNDQ